MNNHKLIKAIGVFILGIGFSAGGFVAFTKSKGEMTQSDVNRLSRQIVELRQELKEYSIPTMKYQLDEYKNRLINIEEKGQNLELMFGKTIEVMANDLANIKEDIKELRK